jgi:hypothetical protein
MDLIGLLREELRQAGLADADPKDAADEAPNATAPTGDQPEEDDSSE